MRLERQFGGDFGKGVHVRGRRRHEQARLAVQLAELVAYGADIALLTGRVEVVAAGLERCLDGVRPKLTKGPTVLQTTLAPLKAFVSASTVCSVSMIS